MDNRTQSVVKSLLLLDQQTNFLGCSNVQSQCSLVIYSLSIVMISVSTHTLTCTHTLNVHAHTHTDCAHKTLTQKQTLARGHLILCSCFISSSFFWCQVASSWSLITTTSPAHLWARVAGRWGCLCDFLINKTVSLKHTALIASCEVEVGTLSVRKTKSLLALLYYNYNL